MQDISIKIDNDLICRAVNEYSDIVFRIAFSSAKNKADAEDITQETFFALIKFQPIIKDESHLKSWLIRVAVNKSKNLIKSAARRKNMMLDETINKYRLTDDDIGVIECVNKLPALERSIVILHYVEGFSAKEIGNIMCKKEDAIFKRLARIRAKLKYMLED